MTSRGPRGVNKLRGALWWKRCLRPGAVAVAATAYTGGHPDRGGGGGQGIFHEKTNGNRKKTTCCELHMLGEREEKTIRTEAGKKSTSGKRQ